MPNPPKVEVAVTIPQRRLLIACVIAVALVYGYAFLSQSVGNGLFGDGGGDISRGTYVLTSLLYPETRFATWIDGGRLPIQFSDRIPIAFGTCVWLALGALVGSPLLKRGFAPDGTWASRFERLAFAILVGLALVSTLTLVIGLLGGLRAIPLCAAIATLVVSVYVMTREKKSESNEKRGAKGDNKSSHDGRSDVSLSAADRPPNKIDRLFFIAIVAMTGFAAAVTMLGACLPPSEFDVLEYHLQAPKEFFRQGYIGFVPHNIYANMPLGTEMHSLAVMTFLGQDDAWLGGLIGKSITASISLVGAVLLGAFLTRRLGLVFGWCAAGLWLTSPGIAYAAMYGLIDGALATYVCASAIATFYAMEATAVRTTQAGSYPRVLTLWRLAGVMSGAAAAAKYPGLILAVLPVLGLFAWSAWRNRLVFQKREAIVVACFITMELAATCGPWYAKNGCLTGNPVYPLAADVFGGKTLTADKIEQWKRAHKARAVLSDAAQPVLTSIFVQPAMIFGVLLGIVSVLSLRQNRNFNLWIVWIAWSCWIVLVWWFATHHIDRFWFPLTGLWAGLGAAGFWWVYQSASRYLALMMVVIGLGYGCVLNSSPINADNRYFVSLEALRNDIGDENQVSRIFPTTAWVNQYLDHRKAKILLVGEARVFEFLAPIEYSTCFDLNPGEIYLRQKSRSEQIDALKQRGITHIMIQWTEINRYRYSNNYGYSDWPQPNDIQHLIDDAVVRRVEWGFPVTFAELLEVQ